MCKLLPKLTVILDFYTLFLTLCEHIALVMSTNKRKTT
jgi:hypothetical protein